MFSFDPKGPEGTNAIVGGTLPDRRFLDAVDAAAIRELGCGLDRPDRNGLWLPVRDGIEEKISATLTIHSSWAEEFMEFRRALQWIGGECTEPVVRGKELSFTILVQRVGKKVSPAGNVHGPCPGVTFRQIPCPW